uniref:Flagellar associated protein n=1 Tax=Romanomermis culicivorax TaxID=13658 RepID=A0A915KRU2_ROMCU
MTPDETCKLSEYRENFANAIGAADFAPAKSYKPKQTYQPPNGEHFANETTHLADFRSWPIGKSESYKPRSQIFQKSPSDEPFKAETTNKAAYKGVGGEMQNAATRISGTYLESLKY